MIRCRRLLGALLLTCGFLVGCASDDSSLATSPRGAAASAQSNTTPGPMSGSFCGNILVQDRGAIDNALARRVSDCLWDAYQRCDVSQQHALTVTYLPTAPQYHEDVVSVTRLMQGCGLHIARLFSVTAIATPGPTAGDNVRARAEHDDCTQMVRDDTGALHVLGCARLGAYDVPE